MRALTRILLLTVLVAGVCASGVRTQTAVDLLLVGFLLLIARWAGLRGRALPIVAAAGIGGFLLLARAEPSVVT